jgi:acyl-CoA synthetase (AMP-forming)/AMP-acid ligase II
MGREPHTSAPLDGAGAGGPLPTWSLKPESEVINGIRFLMYPQRPRHLLDVLQLAHRWGDRTYVVQRNRRMSFADLLISARRAAFNLADAGISAGDRVLVLGWSSLDWIINFWACQVLGAAPVLGNAWWSAVEVGDAIALLDPAAVLADERSSSRVPGGYRQLPWAVQGEATRGGMEGNPALNLYPSERHVESDPAVIIFTSGTSGRPKAVELSHRSLLANLHMLLEVTRQLPQQLEAAAGDVALHTGPLFHVGGSQMLLRTIALGNTIVLPSGRFDPADVLELIERHRVTRWSAVPTMVTRVLDHPDLKRRDITSLTALTIGGSPIHAELLRRIGSELPNVKTGVPTGYGLTENGGQATAASGRDTLRHPGSAGFPLPCAEVGFRTRDDLPDAEILLRSPTQMTGYIGVDESPIDTDGWLHTGDLGRRDDEGRLWITGRAKDLIIRGGENIAPAAVERALTSIDGIVEAAVIGVPHPEFGEEVCAFVVISGGLTAESLTQQLHGQIASFAVPSLWYLQADPLPTNQTGKIDKPALVALARAAADTNMEARAK